MANVFLAVVSAILLTLAFPNFDLWLLAWFALVPLFYAIEREKESAVKSFVVGWLFGTAFFFRFVLVADIFVYYLRRHSRAARLFSAFFDLFDSRISPGDLRGGFFSGFETLRNLRHFVRAVFVDGDGVSAI